MIIRARIAGIIEGTSVHEEGEIEFKEGTTVKKFFKQIDKKMGFKKPKYFRMVFRQGIQPSILLNGDRLDMPDGYKRKLVDGDEITVMLPMSGG